MACDTFATPRVRPGRCGHAWFGRPACGAKATLSWRPGSDAGCSDVSAPAPPAARSVVAVPMNHGVALATGDQPAVDERGRDEGDREAEDDAPPELRVAEAGVDRAGDDEHEEVVDELHHRDRDGV